MVPNDVGYLVDLERRTEQRGEIPNGGVGDAVVARRVRGVDSGLGHGVPPLVVSGEVYSLSCDMSRDFAVCDPTLYNLVMHDWNRRLQERSDKRLVKIIEMVKARYSKVEIAAKFKISRARLYQLIAKAKARGLL